MASLSLKNINKIYPGNVQAVFDFSIDIEDKEFIVFVGPSGCGKSTTLRMIAGLEDISSGELYIDNEFMNNIEPKDRNIAMVFQSYALYPHMTVYENMRFALKLRKIAFPIYEKDNDNEKINALLKEKSALLKEIKAVNRLAKRGKIDKELLEKRKELYAKLYDFEKEIANNKKQLIGKDEYRIYLLEHQVKEFEKAIAYNNALSNKKPELLNELEQKNIQLNKTIEELKKQIEYLNNNEVPLFKLRKPTREEMDIEINKVAEQIDLIPYLYRKPAALSGGQRQRVALGRAMVRKPKVFLMDEPLSNLDAKLRVQTRNEIRKLHESVGATTIYVTHDQIEAMTMADRIVVMKDGYIQQIGTPHEIFNNPSNKFVGGFIGSSPMNFIDARYDGNKFIYLTDEGQEIHIEAAKENKDKLKAYVNKEITLGIRPGDVYLKEDNEKENASLPIKVKKEGVELVGTELIVHTNLNGVTLVVKAKYEDFINSNEELEICLNINKLFAFNKENEERIA